MNQFITALRTLRPRNIVEAKNIARQARTAADSLRTDVTEVRRWLKELRSRDSRDRETQTRMLQQIAERLDTLEQATRQQQDALLKEMASLTHEVATLRVRESQLRAIARQDCRLEPHLAALDSTLSDPAIGTHVRQAIARSTLHLEPFPHIVVDKLLPRHVFDALITGLPPSALFADRAPNKQQLNVPFDVASVYSQRIWQFMARTIGPEFIMPAIVEVFRESMHQWLRQTLPQVTPAQIDALALTCSDGRILLRRPGYRIPPHRDPKWGFITCLMYLPRHGDDQRWGTHLYSVAAARETEAKGAAPHWISDDDCTLVSTVEFVPNRTLFFLNSHGAHGADIPADAEPATLERYAYQFRVGPAADTIRGLLELLPEERLPYWKGKATHY